jgi:hypothetical protein
VRRPIFSGRSQSALLVRISACRVAFSTTPSRSKTANCSNSAESPASCDAALPSLYGCRRSGVTRPVVYSQFTGTGDMLRVSLDREEQRALLAVLWESGRLLLVSPDDFTHDRLLRSLDTLLAAMVAAQ